MLELWEVFVLPVELRGLAKHPRIDNRIRIVRIHVLVDAVPLVGVVDLLLAVLLRGRLLEGRLSPERSMILLR